MMSKLEKGERNNMRFEPHTINFSTISLCNFAYLAGLVPCEISLCKNSEQILTNTNKKINELYGCYPTITNYGSIIAVFKKTA